MRFPVGFRLGVWVVTCMALSLTGCDDPKRGLGTVDVGVEDQRAGDTVDTQGPVPDGGVGEVVAFDAGFETVTLHVSDPVNVDRPLALVSGGVPFARGRLGAGDISRLALADPAGHRVLTFQPPVVLGTWSDGSVKWLLVDFETSLDAGSASEFTLGLADPAPIEAGIELTEDASSITIDTGTMKAVLPKDRFAFLSEVWVDANGDGVYDASEKVVDGPGEMFVDLDDAPPGAADAGAYDYPDVWYLGMEGGNWLRDSAASAATRYLASAGDYAVSVFREGRTHTVLRLEGWHRADGGRQFASYTLYLHFYAYQSVVRASHTWIMTGDPEKNFVRRMAIDMPLVTTSDTLTWTAGGPYESEGAPVTFEPTDPPYVPIIQGPSQTHSGTVAVGGDVSMTAVGPDKYYHNVPLEADVGVDYGVWVDDQEVASGRAPAGWLAVSDGTLGAAVGVRDFWREHPKETRYADGRLGVYLWPDRGGKTLDLRRRYPEVRGTVAQGFGKAARREFNVPGSAVGVAKTTDLFFQFHADAQPAAIDNAFRGFQDPLRPRASGAYNVSTGVFGPLRPYDTENCEKLEHYLDLMMARIIRSQQEYHWFGMLDYGDYLPEFEKQEWELDIPANPNLYSNWGYAGWLQENYRFGQWAAVQYFRGADERYFRAFDVWLRHARDVDCVYHDTPDDGPRPGDNENGHARLGGGHRHDQQHWGTYMASYGIPSIAVVHHYYMTGEGRDLDAMRANADWLLNAGGYFENYGEYAVLYIATALGDDALLGQAMAHDETPQSAYGRATYDSGMGLMMHDIHTDGAPEVRERLRAWADLDEATAAYLRGYLESVEQTGVYVDRIQADLDAAFPDKAVAARHYTWADTQPDSFRDVFTSTYMPDGPWSWPVRVMEDVQFDGPGGMGNDLGRHSNQMTLMWLMPHTGCGL